MAWKRGTQNNQAGVIRKGHIKEFLTSAESRKSSIIGRLKIVNVEDIEQLAHLYESSIAFICRPSNGLPEILSNQLYDDSLYLHAHKYPGSVLLAVVSEFVPHGCIALTNSQRLNSKVCTGENEEWTVYRGEQFVYDAREGAIGDTEIRYSGVSAKSLQDFVMEVRPRCIHNPENICFSVFELSSRIAKNLFGCIITLEDILVVTVGDTQFVCRVHEVNPEPADNGIEDEETDYLAEDNYRGIVEASTVVYLVKDRSCNINFELIDIEQRPVTPTIKNIVHIRTSDDELFPVKRRLLRPCIALTSIVQAGKGKYASDTTSQSLDIITNANTQTDSDESTSDIIATVQISLDACTFDRILLYLEHDIRGEPFRFDPLLAPELLAAAENLEIQGLIDCCKKVLGSFQERVRRIPIRYEEIKRRNDAGRANGDSDGSGSGSSSKRTETLLIMSGMVFDVSRWLDEHPGGSTIIPEQALNVDCTVFFEIYHASRQSFLYLKEFYIGELADSDLSIVPQASSSEGVCASDAFLEQLRRVTSWRLKPEDLISFEIHKSF